MIDLTTGFTRNCEGQTRRDFLRVGGLGVFALSASGMLRAEASQSPGGHRKSPVNCIVLWMDGGPSHIDTFDPKPNAPIEITGPMKAISTNVPGIQIGEWLPKLATVQDKYSIVRSLTSPDASHGTANHYLLTGYKFTPTTSYPTYGAVASREFGLTAPTGMPTHVAMGGYPLNNGGGTFAGYMGAQYNPFNVDGDPNNKNFTVKDLTPPKGLELARVERRRGMLDALDKFQRDVERQAATVKSMDKFYENAFSLVTSPVAKKAFNLDDEKPELREAYGKNTFGQSCLLARRLIECGVRFVTVTRGGWDTHENNFKALKDSRLPEVDQGYSMLLQDLHDRSLLDSTIVVWMGEFGRTPKVNTSAGRDHWSESLVVTIGGGGLRNGIVVGESDENAERPRDKPYRVEDLAATIYQALGIDAEKEYFAPDTRPLKINYDGAPIAELF